ncbi:MAG TPA: hypothetical protein EYP40_00605 [Chromatiales bacterium]|nr:hypothetical protein [Chromatiales bacterium]
MKTMIKQGLAALFGLLFLSVAATAGEARLKPFTLAANVTGIGFDTYARQIRNKLHRAGFRILGTYVPYDGAKIFVITDKGMERAAVQTRYGAFGAVLKVAVTRVGNTIQVSYNNPAYLALAYNMGVDLRDVRRRLKNSIGALQDFGSKEGIAASDLPGYTYMFGLEGFDDVWELAEFSSHAAALKNVEQGLDRGEYGIRQVFRLDLPGGKQTLFGISMQADVENNPFLNDAYVMEVVDYTTIKHTAHLPYEILVDGNQVLAMHAHFRLAINFPELRMFGKHSFGKLMDLPYVYEEYLTRTVGGQWPPAGQDW